MPSASARARRASAISRGGVFQARACALRQQKRLQVATSSIGGPPLDPGAGWRHFCWKKAHARAWKTPPREIALARLARAEALGISYREYTAVLLDTGVHL